MAEQHQPSKPNFLSSHFRLLPCHHLKFSLSDSTIKRDIQLLYLRFCVRCYEDFLGW
ncbi:hypothetical protein Tcan_06002 [Toxocara canis]|uniref:Uncharacterized protein n=1 Tax=Toxocara canis TaxID=6265 RepID=A0A0B2VE87_TOXCA|nr:hypothetical protein Tcan_06002 [Toxocara canis]